MLDRTRVSGWLVVWLATIGLAGTALAADEDRVRSAFILNLAKYVEWPAASFEASDASFVIGVIEDPTFAEYLARQLEGRTVRSRGFEIRTIASVSEALECHLIFGGSKHRQRARAMALELRGEPVLSVAEYDRFAHVGGMIAFEMRQGKISFEISRSAASRGGLKVSSKLLRLASAVR